MLKSRVLTAVISLPLLTIIILWAPPWIFALCAAFIIAVAAWEWSALIGFKQVGLRLVYLVAVLLGLFVIQWFSLWLVLLLSGLFWFWALAAVFSYSMGGHALGFQHPEMRVVIGFFLLVTCWVMLFALRFAPTFSAGWLLAGLAIVWATDTGGYFIGRWYGTRQLTVRVSPKKTWEGLMGGLLLALIVSIPFSMAMMPTQAQRVMFCAVACISALFSVVGDLSVSLVKRHAGVKDSGQIIPGHGGVLDRLDSIAAGLAVFTIGALAWLV